MNLPFVVGTSPTLKIRGIIADRDIAKDEVIEECPIVLLPMEQEEALKQTVLWRYYFEWTNKHHSIVLGYGAMINHSYTPNARYDSSVRKRVMIYKAIKDIKKGEEITVNYNWNPNSKKPVDEFLVDFNEHQK